jgi:hypothetical protein
MKLTARKHVSSRFSLKPWQFRPGQSGNPLGQAANGHAMAKFIRETSGFGVELATFHFRILRGERIQLRDRERPHTPTLQQRMDAAAWLANRGWGLAKETIELTSEATPAQRLELLKRLSDSERDLLRSLLARALERESASNASATAPGAALGPAPEPPAPEHPALPDESSH